MPQYIIGLGSSHPKGPELIQRACDEIAQKLEVLALSPLYPNPAVGGQTLFAFTNAACKIRCNWHPNALWFFLRAVESKLGRIRIYKNGPRTIDLDILISDFGKVKTEYLNVPHAEFKKRPFAFKPASDIGFA